MVFNEKGILDPGIHKMTWKAFYSFFSFSPRRKELLSGLEKVLAILQEIGVTRIYIDGSFVTSKTEPNDWDACFESSASSANKLLCKYPFCDRVKQKELYKGELFYANSEADEHGTKFLDFFQQMRENSVIKKGIVEIIL
jgi:hypothetical protein